jgi:glycosyltransferase involved in cell wall biosynthesis
VVGSRLGGISELVEHGVNGLLVEPGEVHSWRRVMEQLVTDRTVVDRLRSGVRPPRSMDTVADEMLGIYRHLRTHGQTDPVPPIHQPGRVSATRT